MRGGVLLILAALAAPCEAYFRGDPVLCRPHAARRSRTRRSTVCCAAAVAPARPRRASSAPVC